MAKTTGPLRIIGDGTPQNTIVVTADGKLIEGVTSITVWINANDVPTADITIVSPILDAKVIPGTTTLFCQICEEEHDHDCKPTTLGGV